MAGIQYEDWSGFESLVFQILKDVFGFQENEKNHRTKDRNDGGYDGVFFLPGITGDSTRGDSLYKVLFEAKLRAAVENDLPLSDFSKSLIIAINVAANMIIIATNLHFSAKTLEALETYSQRTGLVIKVMTAKELLGWLEGTCRTTDAPKLDGTRLLKLIQDAEASANRHPAGALSLFAPLGDCMPSAECSEQLIGQERKNLVQSALKQLALGPGAIVLMGEEGVGKSVISHTLLRESADANTNKALIDLRLCNTPRDFFIRILSLLWQIPVDTLLRLDQWDKTIEYLGNEALSEDLRQAVLYALEQSDAAYAEKASLFNVCLLEYLFQVYQMTRRTLLIVFSNADRASMDCLPFFVRFCTRFQTCIRIILEWRHPLKEPSAQNADSRAHAREECFAELNSQGCVRETYIIKPPNRAENRRYLVELFNGQSISEEVLDQIIDDAGDNPLQLTDYAKYLSKSIDLPEISVRELLHKRERLLYRGRVFCGLLNSICCEDTGFQEIFALIGMLDGTVYVNCLEAMTGQEQFARLEYLKRERICELYGAEYLTVRHYQYLYAIRQYEYIGEVMLQRLAVNLLKRLDIYLSEKHKKDDVELHLLQILHRYSDAIQKALSMAKLRYESAYYYAAFDYAEIAERLLQQQRHGILQTIQVIDAKSYMVQSEFYIREHPTEWLNREIQELRAQINLNQYDLMSNSRYGAIVCRQFLIENQFYHQIGDFKKAYDVTQNGLSFLEEFDGELDDIELACELWFEHGIATKEIHMLSDAINVLKKGLERYPNSLMLQFTLNTQQYEYFFPAAVQTAKTFLEANVQLEPLLKPADIYHNRVHLLNCALFAHPSKLSQIIVDGQVLLKKTATYGLRNEDGRIYNILGCCFLLSKDLKKAEEHFQRGKQIFQGSNYVSNLWPLLINYGTLFTKCGEYKRAEEQFAAACELIVDKYAYRLRALQYLPEMGLPRLLGGLAILYVTLPDLEANCTSPRLSEIRTRAEKLLSAHIACEDVQHILKESVYCFGDISLIGY